MERSALGVALKPCFIFSDQKLTDLSIAVFVPISEASQAQMVERNLKLFNQI